MHFRSSEAGSSLDAGGVAVYLSRLPLLNWPRSFLHVGRVLLSSLSLSSGAQAARARSGDADLRAVALPSPHLAVSGGFSRSASASAIRSGCDLRDSSSHRKP